MSKQEEIKQALAALKPSTELYMVWDQQDGLLCITDYDMASQEYEGQLEAAKGEVSSYGSEGNERVVFARVEKQAYVTIYETSDHSDLMAAWDEYERENTENVELERLHKELEEAQQAMSEPHKNLWFKWTNERNRLEEARTEAIYLARKLEEERKQSAAVRKAMQDVLYYLQRDSYVPAQDILEQYLALGQEGEGNQE